MPSPTQPVDAPTHLPPQWPGKGPCVPVSTHEAVPRLLAGPGSPGELWGEGLNRDVSSEEGMVQQQEPALSRAHLQPHLLTQHSPLAGFSPAALVNLHVSRLFLRRGKLSLKEMICFGPQGMRTRCEASKWCLQLQL